MDLVEPGCERITAAGRAGRDPPADARPVTTTCCVGRGVRPGFRDVSVAGGIDRCASQPNARLAVGGHRFPHSAIGFSRAYVDGPVGPVLRATKTHRTYRVAVDDESMQRLVDHYLQVQVRYRERMLKEDVAINQPGAVADAAPKACPQDGKPGPGER